MVNALKYFIFQRLPGIYVLLDDVQKPYDKDETGTKWCNKNMRNKTV